MRSYTQQNSLESEIIKEHAPTSTLQPLFAKSPTTDTQQYALVTVYNKTKKLFHFANSNWKKLVARLRTTCSSTLLLNYDKVLLIFKAWHHGERTDKLMHLQNKFYTDIMNTIFDFFNVETIIMIFAFHTRQPFHYVLTFQDFHSQGKPASVPNRQTDKTLAEKKPQNKKIRSPPTWPTWNAGACNFKIAFISLDLSALTSDIQN